MSKRFNFFKVITIALCFVLVFTTLFFNAGDLYAQEVEEPEGMGVESQGDVSAMAIWGDPTVYNKLSDPDTSNTTAIVQPFDLNVIENGRLWMDKSVNKDVATIYDIEGDTAGSYTAAADEFLVTLSALSEAYSIGMTVPPIDVVFIVDVSGSMTYGFTGDTEGTVGNRRVDALVAGLNQAIDSLMTANPNNRVAVVAYGGLPQRHPRSYKLLDLGRYSMPGTRTDFFSVQPTSTFTDPNYTTGATNAFLTVSGDITGTGVDGLPISSFPPGVPVLGGTPTQQGIYTGAQILATNTDRTFTDNGITVARKPIMILMTDGEPTFGWADYTNPFLSTPIVGTNYQGESKDMYYQAGDAITPDIGIDLLTVASASYWKEQIQANYFAAGYPVQTECYTIGVFVKNVHTQSVLDPANFAGGNDQAYGGDANIAAGTYNLAERLNTFSGLPAGGTIGFPILPPVPYSIVFGSSEATLFPRTSMVITKATNGSPQSYNYTNGYFQADNANALKAIFETIASQIVTQESFITNISGGDPDFKGYLTFSDVLGQYMEVKSYQGLWFDVISGTSKVYTEFTGQTFAADIGALGSSSPNWVNFTTTLAKQMDDGTGKVTQAIAADVTQGSIRAGILYSTSPTVWGNQIRWYADAEKNYIGPYYNSTTGASLPVPAGAKCIMDIYPISGTVKSDVDGHDTDLTTVCFVVLTALSGGTFTDAEDKAMNIKSRTLIAGQQIVRLYVPASLIPMRTVSATVVSNQLNATINQSSPIRAVFTVGLQDAVAPKVPTTAGVLDLDSVTLSGIANTYKQNYRTPKTGFGARYNFYTNQYRLPDANITNVFCEIAPDNPYYFYNDPSGSTPLYKPDGSGGYRLAVRGDSAPFFAKEEYYDQEAPGYIVEDYKQVVTNQILNNAPAPRIPNGREKAKVLGTSNTINKPANPTMTKAYSVMTNDTIVASNYRTQVRQLGNNGRFSIPVTQVNVRKVWYVSPRVPIDVELHGQVGTGADAVLDTQTLRPANSWRYSWYPVRNGGKELLVYSYYPDGTGNVDLINYSVQEVFPNGVQPDYPVSITGPTFNANNNSWSTATIRNGIRPNTPPATPPPPGGGDNAETGDQTDLLLWWMLLCIAVLGLCFIYKVGEYYRIKRRRAEERQ